jgi:hypothetical protein
MSSADAVNDNGKTNGLHDDDDIIDKHHSKLELNHNGIEK